MKSLLPRVNPKVTCVTRSPADLGCSDAYGCILLQIDPDYW